MAFDITLAIAEMDFKGFGYADAPDTAALRERYPELAFVFDRLDDLEAKSQVSVEKAEYDDLEREVERLSEILDDCNTRAAHIRDLTLIVSRMDKPGGYEFSNVANQAEDLHRFIEAAT